MFLVLDLVKEAVQWCWIYSLRDEPPLKKIRANLVWFLLKNHDILRIRFIRSYAVKPGVTNVSSANGTKHLDSTDMRVLDVGCGTGNPPVRARVSGIDTLIGADIGTTSLRTARVRYPDREFVCCRAESLPFADAAFERVVSSVALPYTHIPPALAEIRRVLKPEGTLFMSLHHLGCTLKELGAAFPRPAVMAFRLYVIANGLFFHFSGRTVDSRTDASNLFRPKGV